MLKSNRPPLATSITLEYIKAAALAQLDQGSQEMFSHKALKSVNPDELRENDHGK